MKKHWLMGLVSALVAAPAIAQAGDPAAGEAAYGQCASCHSIVDLDGGVIAGRANNKAGPNLYGVMGRQAGSVEGFRYKKDLVAAGEAGLVWDEASVTAYIQDTSAYLTEALGSRARSGMAYKVRDPEEAANIAAFLAQHGAATQ